MYIEKGNSNGKTTVMLKGHHRLREANHVSTVTIVGSKSTKTIL